MGDGRGGEFIKQINTRDRALLHTVRIYTTANFNDCTFDRLHWENIDDRT